MFTYKFYSNARRKNAIILRITNNRRKAEMNLGIEAIVTCCSVILILV